MAVVEERAAGKGACAAIRCCLEAKPCAGPTSCLGLSACSPHAQSATPALHRPLGQHTREDRAMSLDERNGGNTRKGSPAGGGGGGGRPAMAVGAWAVSALCLLLSVGSAAACLLLGAQASALQGRVAALEEERELLQRAGPPGALATWAEPHLERLLREVRSGSGVSEWGAGRCVRVLGAPDSVAVFPRRVCSPALSARVHPGGLLEGLSVGKARCRPQGVLLSPLQPQDRVPGQAAVGKVS